MSEFRQKPTTKEWVIIAPERADRPKDIAAKAAGEGREQPPEYDENCPFCPGNEHKTPDEVYREDADGGWALRAVPNKYAALSSTVTPERQVQRVMVKANGYGAAEVIIESPHHNPTIATMSNAEVERIIRAYKDRYQDIISQEHINFVTIFRNYGPQAGTSLVHPHSQVIATPVIPPHIRDPIYKAIESFDTFGNCIYCTVLEQELEVGDRVVLESDYFLVRCPFAARSPFEIRIIPKIHRASFGDISPEESNDLADVLRKTLRKVYFGLGDPDYNYIIRSAPYGDDDARYLHWYIVIIPKLHAPGGFEISSGIYINPTLPEECADFLRGIDT